MWRGRAASVFSTSPPQRATGRGRARRRHGIQARHATLRDERARTQAQLDDLTTAVTPDQDPALLDELPYLAAQLAEARPPCSKP
jgi:hypothetical protein